MSKPDSDFRATLADASYQKSIRAALISSLEAQAARLQAEIAGLKASQESSPGKPIVRPRQPALAA